MSQRIRECAGVLAALSSHAYKRRMREAARSSGAHVKSRGQIGLDHARVDDQVVAASGMTRSHIRSCILCLTASLIERAHEDTTLHYDFSHEWAVQLAVSAPREVFGGLASRTGLRPPIWCPQHCPQVHTHAVQALTGAVFATSSITTCSAPPWPYVCSSDCSGELS